MLEKWKKSPDIEKVFVITDLSKSFDYRGPQLLIY